MRVDKNEYFLLERIFEARNGLMPDTLLREFDILPDTLLKFYKKFIESGILVYDERIKLTKLGQELLKVRYIDKTSIIENVGKYKLKYFRQQINDDEPYVPIYKKFKGVL